MTSADFAQSSTAAANNSTDLDARRSKRRSRASDTLLATATALLKVLGVNPTARRSRRKRSPMEKIYGQSASTMPAMPKEKSSPIPLSENTYPDLRKKEALMSPVVTFKKDNSQTISTGTTTTAAVATNIHNNYDNNKSSSTTPPASATENHPAQPQQQQQQQQQHPESGGGGGQNGVVNITRRSANDFRFGKSIGEGSFSTVYLAKDIHTNKEYAIKVCEKQHIIREKKQEYIKREREVMNVMSGVPGFVNLYCTFQDARRLYFVMTYAKNGDLLPYINKVGSFDLSCTRFYVAELVLALENMHSRGVIHRDLKPENILLDDEMHTLIADFGSAKLLTHNEMVGPASAVLTKKSSDRDHSEVDDNNDDHDQQRHHHHQRYQQSPRMTAGGGGGGYRGRKNSFVGTAQYVSPEILKGQQSNKAADLWALGCIIYQMISGLPPFRAGSEYLIFQKILKQDLTFPDGFDRQAKDLVEKLLRIDPSTRIGANDVNNKYVSIRSHPFFDGIDWDNLRTQQPPQIYPYLPGLTAEEELRSQYRVPDHLEPGLDEKQLTRLLGLDLGTSVAKYNIEPKNIAYIPEAEKQQRLENQKTDKWNEFVDGELILKAGYVNKRKGLFARKRMLLLTTGPRLFYVDPAQMVKKGEIPWSPELRVEPKNFKIFFVHTPNRTYYLEDPEGYALEWCRAIDDVRKATYGYTS